MKYLAIIMKVQIGINMSNTKNKQPFFIKFPDFSVISATTNWIFRTILFSLIHAVVLLVLWNLTIPNTFPSVKMIEFYQAVGLVLITKLLSRSWIQEARNEILLNILNVAHYQTNNIASIMMYLANRFGIPQAVAPSQTQPPENPVVNNAHPVDESENIDSSG
jgi:hypothetical protein